MGVASGVGCRLLVVTVIVMDNDVRHKPNDNQSQLSIRKIHFRSAFGAAAENGLGHNELFNTCSQFMFFLKN